MNQRLAKQLKDSDFPYNPKYNGLRDWVWLPIKEMTKDDREKLFIPTLSELIDAVIKTKGVNHETFIMSGLFPKLWRVYVWKRKESYVEVGSSLEEAVAKLWLILNKKK